jgi:UDP:flavonoid glycosyltransferase YjiC (YdhE family)
MLDTVKPDVMVCDFSPSALLAARCRGIKTIRIGGSYFSPTNMYPMPNLFIMQGARYVKPESVTTENNVTKNINTALENLGYPTIKQLGDIFDAGKTITMGFLETDHMLVPDGREYYGIIRGSGKEQIEWPSSEDPNAPKVFVYTYQCGALAALLTFFRKQNYRVIVRDNNLDESFKQLFHYDNIVFTKQILNFETLGQEADLCVTNGNFTSTIEFLLSGCKVLMIPTHGEQTIVSLKIERSGLGRMFLELNDEHAKIAGVVHNLMMDKQIAENVKVFAEKYRHLTQDIVIENIINEILR